MKEQESLQASFEVFRHNLQNFIDISLLEDETSWMDWIDNVSRKNAMDHYYLALNHGGYIFLGSSESPSRINSAFKIEKSDKHLVYFKG